MRALLFDGHEARLTSVPDPVPGPHAVLLQVTAAGLCHSDLAVMRRPVEQIRFPLPVVLGHEACGTVVQVGREVCLAPGVMEARSPRKDASHGSTAELPGGASGARSQDDVGGPQGSSDSAECVQANR
jgi:NADPH:quinone reductase-like Zn-dependent oxidoreductase